MSQMKSYGLTMRVLILAIVILCLLQFIYFLLMTRPSEEFAGDRLTNLSISGLEDVLLVNLIRNMDKTPVMDSGGEYRIIRDVITPDMMSNKNDVSEVISLCTHCSVRHVHRLHEMSAQWKGHISVSVFIDDDVVQSIKSIVRLFICSSLGSVSLHLIIPLSSQLSSLTPQHLQNIDCHTDVTRLRGINVQNYAVPNLKYPNNLLRNVAIENSKSKYILMVDIDIVPNQDLYESFVEMTKSFRTGDDNLTAFVIPTFELHESSVIPRDKNSLIELWKEGLIRPFYDEACRKCQNHTLYDKWRGVQMTERLSVAYEAEWRDPWEPFYILTRSAPKYSELFKQYGFNRISQSCELHVAGYRFLVLNNAFLVHRGFKKKHGFHSNRTLENNLNKMVYRAFKEDLKLKYPNSNLTCSNKNHQTIAEQTVNSYLVCFNK